MRKRREQINRAVANPFEVQQQTLKDLLLTAQKTEFGEKYDFKNIATPKAFTQRVPVHSYDDLQPYINRVFRGEQNVLWPSEIRWFAKSSGTTAKSKFIPVSFEALEECHFKGGRDVLSIYCSNYPDTRIFEGKGLLIGGSHNTNEYTGDTFYGDLSAVMMNNMPFWSSLLSTPKPEIALLADWEEKLEKMTAATVNEDVRSISGVPTWTLVVLKRLLEMKKAGNMLEIWPNFELFIHGGVSFTPYAASFKEIFPSDQVHYVETYNASEGFFAIQDDPRSDDMLLMMDYGIYYEFIPLSELDTPFPKTVPLESVNTNTPYALAISTNAGLWRYLLGDTITFTSTHPYRIKIAGRTKNYINVFGEELMVHNSDYAIKKACEQTGAIIKEYTAGPVFLDMQHKGGHEWLIEFEKNPDDLDIFKKTLDEALKEANSDYEAKRSHNLALLEPKLTVCQPDTFHRWLKKHNKLGGQNKVPRLRNDRTLIEELHTLNH